MFSCTCSHEKLGFASFRLSNSSLGSTNSSLGPSALGMNFFSLGMNYSLQIAKPNSSFLQCTKLYNSLLCSVSVSCFHEKIFIAIVSFFHAVQRVRIKIRLMINEKINFTEFLSIIVRVKFCNSILPVFHG